MASRWHHFVTRSCAWHLIATVSQPCNHFHSTSTTAACKLENQWRPLANSFTLSRQSLGKLKTAVESTAENMEENTKRSARFWFDDGNVVVQAESTQFRVHRSVLSLHSQIMKDCFSCPQPADAPMVEDCPVVHLSDSADDIEKLCAFLYGLYR